MSESQFQALSDAVQERNVRKVKKFLKQGISVLSPAGTFSLFHVAAQMGDEELIRAMSASASGASGADVNTPTKDGATPVFIAVLEGHVDVINALYALGADVNTPDKNGCTPVYVAAHKGYVDAINALCALGADVNTPNKNGYTPVFVAAQEGHVDAINALCA